MSEPPLRRILLTIDSVTDRMALEAAAELASLLPAHLQGVFVESSELLRLARLPFAREISLASATGRRLESVQLERELKTQALQVRQALESRAGHWRIEWSFQVVRGALANALALAGGGDIIILGRTRTLAAAPRPSTGTILVAFDGSPGSLRALETAVTLAGRQDGILLLLPVERTAELRELAATRLGPQAGHAHYLSLAELTPHQIVNAGRRYHCRLLLVGDDPAQPGEIMQQLVHNANCPVAMVR